MLLTSNPETSTFTDQEKADVHEQLERLLASPYFSHSRRFPALLRFVVENTLAGRSEVLKERTLGVEVFGKRARYDTADSPIVRVTAAEIRKRIALYYNDAGHESELKFSLPPGSYVPHFEWPGTREHASATEIVPDAAPDSAEAAASPGAPVGLTEQSIDAAISTSGVHAVSSHKGKARWMLLGGLATALVLLAAFGWWKVSAGSAIRAFWGPVLRAGSPVLFCVADQTEYTDIQLRDAANPAHQSVLRDNLTAVVIDDLVPIMDIAGVLRQNGTSYNVRAEGVTTLSDLRNGPAVFIGAFDNAWTLRLLQPLRFHFANNPEMSRFWIVDSASNRPSSWVVDRQEQIATNIYRDYAIVSRFTDSDTGRLSVVVAGIGRGGTIAAGEFLTTPSLLNQVGSVLSEKKSVEIVLSTQIIGGQPGTPRVEAVYSW